MLLKYSRYYVLLIYILLLSVCSIAQGTGRAILNITFGEGAAHPGPPLPATNTRFNFGADAARRRECIPLQIVCTAALLPG